GDRAAAGNARDRDGGRRVLAEGDSHCGALPAAGDGGDGRRAGEVVRERVAPRHRDLDGRGDIDVDVAGAADDDEVVGRQAVAVAADRDPAAAPGEARTRD